MPSDCVMDFAFSNVSVGGANTSVEMLMMDDKQCFIIIYNPCDPAAED